MNRLTLAAWVIFLAGMTGVVLRPAWLVEIWLFFAAVGLVAATRSIQRSWEDVLTQSDHWRDVFRDAAHWPVMDQRRHARLKLARARLRREVGRLSISASFLTAGVLAWFVQPSAERGSITVIHFLLVLASAINSMQSVLDDVVETDLRQSL